MLLASPLWAGGEAPRMAIKVYGAVEHPGDFRVEPSEATLALMLECAGGIREDGCDKISVRVGSALRILQIDAFRFYAGGTDYVLPNDTMVSVPEHIIGGFSPEDYARLQKLQKDYMKRRREGKIKLVDLLTLFRAHGDDRPANGG